MHRPLNVKVTLYGEFATALAYSNRSFQGPPAETVPLKFRFATGSSSNPVHSTLPPILNNVRAPLLLGHVMSICVIVTDAPLPLVMSHVT